MIVILVSVLLSWHEHSEAPEGEGTNGADASEVAGPTRDEQVGGYEAIE